MINYEFGDNRLKKLIRFFYKWLWCSWKHGHKCYPKVWKIKSHYWHCTKCHPCGEGFDFLMGTKTIGWL